MKALLVLTGCVVAAAARLLGPGDLRFQNSTRPKQHEAGGADGTPNTTMLAAAAADAGDASRGVPGATGLSITPPAAGEPAGSDGRAPDGEGVYNLRFFHGHAAHDLGDVDGASAHRALQAADGAVQAWGRNVWGSLALGSNTDQNTPRCTGTDTFQYNTLIA
eukprot:COSAG06_NODE_5618_length_3348_cov_1.454266_1_plen_163_part_00